MRQELLQLSGRGTVKGRKQDKSCGSTRCWQTQDTLWKAWAPLRSGRQSKRRQEYSQIFGGCQCSPKEEGPGKRRWFWVKFVYVLIGYVFFDFYIYQYDVICIHIQQSYVSKRLKSERSSFPPNTHLLHLLSCPPFTPGSKHFQCFSSFFWYLPQCF